jgi:hypothetical protein
MYFLLGIIIYNQRPMLLTAAIEARLHQLDGAASVEVREDGIRVATIETFCWELRGAPANPVLPCDPISSMSRTASSPSPPKRRSHCFIFRAACNSRPGRIEFLRVGFQRPQREIAREEFRLRLVRILAERFPDETLEPPLS